jgi:Na+-translocating ferredoxin:NAD+ oxidoreductase RnfG subunit
MKKILKPYSFLVLAMMLVGFGLPKKLQKKVNKVIQETYDVEDFSLEIKEIPLDIAKELPSKFETDNFFQIIKNQSLIGYAYIAKAPSKTAQFDYLVLLDTELIVKKTKVLVYREEYGGEIGSKRWLKQFIGSSKESNYKLHDNIVAISGATISVRSMTNAMNNFFASLKILTEKEIL